MPTKYRSKSLTIEAVQFDGSLQSVDGFLPYEAFEYRPAWRMPTGSAPSCVTVQAPLGPMIANTGDYIIKFDDGRISVMDVGSFHDNYEAVE